MSKFRNEINYYIPCTRFIQKITIIHRFFYGVLISQNSNVYSMKSPLFEVIEQYNTWMIEYFKLSSHRTYIFCTKPHCSDNQRSNCIKYSFIWLLMKIYAFYLIV